MASDAALAPPSLCASPSRRHMESASLQRPFTASGARTTRLLAVQIHWGEHLHHYCQRQSLPSDQETTEQETTLPSTYVALRVSRGPTSAHTSKREHEDEPLPNDRSECYELQSSPFATSRVVERSAYPLYNELLLVPLPVDWRSHADAAAYRLHVDVVGRDPSQQEDSLLATVALALLPLATHITPQHLALALPVDGANGNGHAETQQPRVYVSLWETTDHDHQEPPEEVVELTIHEVVDAATALATAQLPLMMVLMASSPHSVQNNLRDVFMGSPGDRPTSGVGCVWISPVARLKASGDSADKRLQWQFPVTLVRNHHPNNSNNSSNHSPLDELQLQLFQVTASSHQATTFTCVASGQVALHHIPFTGSHTAMTAALPRVAADMGKPPSQELQLKLTVRRWDASAWRRFQTSSVSRRIITTNRRHRRRAELQALEWTGALCRGLNRYPISSFCDEGGLSSLLATYLSASTTTTDHGGDSDPRAGGDDDRDCSDNTRLPQELLNQHVRLLQQEVMAKQETIQKLQHELDTRQSALQRCGVELIAARTTVRARDELVSQLQARVREMDERDASQTRELLTNTSGLSGLRLDSQGAQRMDMLIFKYKELEQRHQATVGQLVEAKRAVGVYEQLERKYTDLEQAHVTQAALVQRLQKDKIHTTELQKTIRLQEKVIRKFEKTVHQQLQTAPAPAPAPAPTPLQAVAPTVSMPSTAVASESPLLAVRVQVLEQQLHVNAKSAANEIGRLKMRIMELETQLSPQ